MFILCLFVIMSALFISVILSSRPVSLPLGDQFYQQLKLLSEEQSSRSDIGSSDSASKKPLFSEAVNSAKKKKKKKKKKRSVNHKLGQEPIPSV